jgi:hypothetical protein
MTIPGNWVLHYDWNVTGTYSTSNMTFNANGTFTGTPSLTGKWYFSEGKIFWRYDGSPATVYSGDGADKALSGISSTLGGLNGAWYAHPVGLATLAEAVPEAAVDAAGNKTR